jgi:protease-4
MIKQRTLPKIALGIYLMGLYTTALMGCAFVNVSLKDERRPLQEQTIGGSGSSKILVTDVSGFISSSERQADLLGNTMLPSLVSRVKEELEKAEQDKRVVAIVLRINSPGGTVTASDMIYHDIKTFREKTGKPVIACIMDMGTSGAYYIAQAADRIMAHPTTITGSIGVIMVRPDIEVLLTKLGIRTTEIKSGELKAMGSPFKPLSSEEQKLFQNIIDEMYGRFLKVVGDGRKQLSPEKIRALADGRIYTAEQSLEAGLIDGIGYLSDAVQLAKQQVGLEQAKIIMYYRPGDFKGSIYAGPPIPNPVALISALEGLTTPQFLYFWMP